MGKQFKTISNSGFDISGFTMMKKLEQQAKEGWLLNSMTTLNFKLKKGQPQELAYSFDYQSDLQDEQEYFSLFLQAGWKPVCNHNGFYIFSAPIGTVPIYTDTTYLTQQRNKRKKVVLFALGNSVLALLMGFYFQSVSTNKTMDVLASGLSILAASAIGFLSVWSFGLFFRKGK